MAKIDEILAHFKKAPEKCLSAKQASEELNFILSTVTTLFSSLVKRKLIHSVGNKMYMLTTDADRAKQTKTEEVIVAPSVIVKNTVFEKQHIVPGVGDPLYLTGSRFFGCVGERSDCDYFVQDSYENREVFIKKGFRVVNNELYIGDTQNVLILAGGGERMPGVFPDDDLCYDIQFVNDVDLKRRVQSAIYSFLETDEKHKNVFHATSRDRTFKTLSRFYWMLAFKMFGLEKTIECKLEPDNAEFNKLFVGVNTRSFLTKNDWFVFANAMFEQSKR